MIINFLQQRQPPVLPVLHSIESEDKDEDYFFDDIDKLKGFGSANQESLGGLFFAFFRRFAVEFDYDHQVVSVRQGRYLSKKEKGWDTGRNRMSLCVEEPFNVGRNLGNSADIVSVLGLRCEFQRFLDLLLAGEDLESICALYQPMSLASTTTEIPSNANSSILSLTLPAENRTSSFFLPIHASPDYITPSTAHPYDRRRSMVDGICSYPSPILSDSYNNNNTHFPSFTYRAPSINKPHYLTSNTFHPRFSSPQALDSILKVRNTRHGSHPLPPVPSTLLSMLNINANHGTDQSVDKIFARYHRKQQPVRQQPSLESKPAKKATVSNRRKSGNSNTPNNTNSNFNNHNHHHTHHHHHHYYNERKPRRRSSGMEWPTISKSNSTPGESTTMADTPRSSLSSEQPQRSRRWSTTKKQLQQATEALAEPKKRTLAEIVKVHTPPPSSSLIKQKSPPNSPIPSTSTSSSKSNSRSGRKQRNSKPSASQGNNNKQKKKNIKPRA
jgi:DNA polymerase sigma